MREGLCGARLLSQHPCSSVSRSPSPQGSRPRFRSLTHEPQPLGLLLQKPIAFRETVITPTQNITFNFRFMV